MVKRNVIVRNMNALESLGAVTNVCSDKTGTLTQGKMVAKRAYIPAYGTFTVDDISDPNNPTIGKLIYSPASPAETDDHTADEIPDDAKPVQVENLGQHVSNPALKSFLLIGSLCNLATVHHGKDGEWTCRGDPTEIGIQVFVTRFDFGRLKLMASASRAEAGDATPNEEEAPLNDTEAQWHLEAEFPFDSDVKRMAVVFKRRAFADGSTSQMVFMKGAVERVLEACGSVRTQEGDVEITDERKDGILANMEALAKDGLRVLALASREWTEDVKEWRGYPRANVEKEMTFLGLIGLYDPPRPESYRTCPGAFVLNSHLTYTLLQNLSRNATELVLRFTCSLATTRRQLKQSRSKSVSFPRLSTKFRPTLSELSS